MILLISYVTLDLPYYIGLYRIFLYVLFIVTCCLSKIKNSWFLIPDSYMRKVVSTLSSLPAMHTERSTLPIVHHVRNIFSASDMRSDMMTSSNGNVFCVTGLLYDAFPSRRPVTRCFAVFFICAWTNNRDASDLRRHRAHYDATVMDIIHQSENNCLRLENTGTIARHMYASSK